jgi:hypothetical protein
MLITVELVGMARILAGKREVAIPLKGDATGRDALSALVREVPALAGSAIDITNVELVGAYLLSHSETGAITDLDAALSLGRDSRLLLFQEMC